jgi:hypothetical protein
MIIVLSSALWTVEGDPHDDDAFSNATDALWCVFWLVTALGFDGPMGTGGAAGQCIIAVAILSGLLLTTMPITVRHLGSHSARTLHCTTARSARTLHTTRALFSL